MGVGGFTGYRIWWPAGLESMTPAERAEALERGWWDVATDDPIRFERLFLDGQKLTIFSSRKTPAVRTR